MAAAQKAHAKVKKVSVSAWKKKCDRVFSTWVRSQGAVDGTNECYTCGVRLPIERMQAAHFISRTHSATRFLPENVKPSCFRCNVWLNGNLAFFADRLLKEMGRKKFDALIAKGRSIHQFSIKELQGIYNTYR